MARPRLEPMRHARSGAALRRRRGYLRREQDGIMRRASAGSPFRFEGAAPRGVAVYSRPRPFSKNELYAVALNHRLSPVYKYANKFIVSEQ